MINIVFSQPNDPQLQKLLQYHNDLRRNLTECKFEGQPPAKYLPDLKWDNELASKAKDLANECYFHHNDVNLPHKWEYVGQNIAGYQTIEQAFDAWKDEYKEYNYYSMSCYGVCGHYTQLVWQNTTHVGCGITNCTGNYGFPYGLSVVCNYGPGGNYEGRYPYEAKSQDECYAVTTRLLNLLDVQLLLNVRKLLDVQLLLNVLELLDVLKLLDVQLLLNVLKLLDVLEPYQLVNQTYQNKYQNQTGLHLSVHGVDLPIQICYKE
ncbi:GLIPR1-like protein 1, variant 2 [Schistosoma haematobium]|uniref:GLIPR1-like protein 1, variant 2 n=1 Tax=Schistosoma haematobium TaxID=6185 RepID=A0A922IJW9_SCHHA|nr:GLIPR1-like protein 1, variant 2 [Schistosoma haematobium]KAH9581223.1 GLIPR1-like protein 1, variant 2 [Schistosoma haematobium]